MRKFIKGLLIASLSMIIVGAIGMTIFLSVGGLRQLTGEIAGGFIQLRDNVVQVWRTIPGVERLNSIETINISFEGMGLDVEINDAYEIYEGNYSDLEVATSAEITDLDISAMGNEFSIKASDTDYYGIEADNCEKFQYFVENGKLSLHILPKIQNVNGNPTGKMTLLVPADCVYNEVSCILGSGTATIDIPIKATGMKYFIGAGTLKANEKLESDTFSVVIGAGEVQIDELLVKSMTADLGAGILDVCVGEVEDGAIRVGMGTAEYNGTISKSLKLDCGMGSLTANLLGKEENQNYRIAGAVGTVSINDDSFSGLAMARDISNNADIDVDINCAMGNVVIRFSE